MNSQTKATSAVCRASFGSRQAQRGSYISKLRPRSRATAANAARYSTLSNVVSGLALMRRAIWLRFDPNAAS